MAEKKTRGPQRGSPRVAAWVHEVINPLLEAIPMEISFLESGNTTWRFYNGRPEYLRPIEGYIAPEARRILDDFRLANPEAGQPFGRHDELLAHLVAVAGDAHRVLMNREDFVQRVRNRLTEFMQTPPRADYPGGALPEADFPKLVGERVVNAVKEIPSHYSDAKFWERYRDEFANFGSGPEFERLREARDALLKHDRKLYEWLRQKSFRLCEEYDVPAAPFPSWRRATRTVGSA